MTATADPVVSLTMTRGCPWAPPAQHRQIREESPLVKVRLPTGATTWVASRHQDVRDILSDPRFSANRAHPGFPRMRALPFPPSRTPMLLDMDAPEHGRARRAVIGEFTVKRLAAREGRIQQIVDELVDAMLAGPRPVDLVQAFSLPVPTLVICEILGVPYADHEFFQTHSKRLVNGRTPTADRAQSYGELMSFLRRLVVDKEQSPGDDLLSRQIQQQREEGNFDREALVAMGFLLLLAGHESTASMISLSTLALLHNPEQLDKIRQDPSKAVTGVEELLRFFTISDSGVGRVAMEDVEIGGVVIRAGEGVLTLSHTANRDPEVFENPDALDVERGTRRHLAFGFGPHQCLGQNLARMELRIVINTLFRRIPGLRLAVPVEQLSFNDNASVYGMPELPVTW
jgi:cytochrome P450